MGLQYSKRTADRQPYVEENLPKNVLWVQVKGIAIIDKKYVELISQTITEELESVKLADLA